MAISKPSAARIKVAATAVDPVFRDTPQFYDEQLCAALGRRVLVKVETVNPLRSFKGRGVDFWAQGIDGHPHLICASAGNFGQALAYVGCRRGMTVDVFVPADVNPGHVARMRLFGASVTACGDDFGAAKEAARAQAAELPNARFVEDGGLAAIAEGAGTIGVELLTAGPLDAVVVPVGDGALINGVALWVKENSPRTRVVGVCAAGAPSMVDSWRAGRPIAGPRPATIADGLAIQVPVAESVAWMHGLVDDMVLVDDAALIEAMRLAADTLGLLLEPSGAAGLAALRTHDLPGERVAVVLTGSNVHARDVRRLLAP